MKILVFRYTSTITRLKHELCVSVNYELKFHRLRPQFKAECYWEPEHREMTGQDSMERQSHLPQAIFA